MVIHEIPGKLSMTWNPDVKAIINIWYSYFITMEELKEAVLVKGLNFAKANGAIAWIVDSQKAEGVFSQEIQRFIETDIFPAFANNGIKYFMTITAENAQTRATIDQYSAKVGPAGINLLDGFSVEGAINWLIKYA